LRVDYADISLLGGREENQDRVTAAVAEHAALLLVVDGMGGHANGARAAEVTQLAGPQAGAKLVITPDGGRFGSLGSAEADAEAASVASELLWTDVSTRRGALFIDVVAPTVLREINGEAGSLSAQQFGAPNDSRPFLQAAALAGTAAFMDSLVAQQDRHGGNARWDDGNQKLGLIDHGYTFALPGHRLNAAWFVDWRFVGASGSRVRKRPLVGSNGRVRR